MDSVNGRSSTWKLILQTIEWHSRNGLPSARPQERMRARRESVPCHDDECMFEVYACT